jgi:hypothetical protein
MTKRTIQSVYDDDAGREIAAADLLDGPESAVHLLRHEVTARHLQGVDRYFCPKCKGPVWPSLYRGRFLNHYAPADPTCEWYTGKLGKLREIDRERFLWLTESPLHRRLVRFIHDMAEADARFEWAKKDRERITDKESGLWRKPDVWAMFGDKEVVFELQLSRTYLKDIVGREQFYLNHGIFMVWIFHSFERFKELAAAKDIYFVNRANALELDHEAETESRKAGKLKLKAHWYGYAPDASGNLKPSWQSRIIDLDDLLWDSETFKPYLIDPEAEEFAYLRERHKDWLARFEAAWLLRHDKEYVWQQRAFRRAWDRFADFLDHRPLPTCGEAENHEFATVLDQLYAIRDGIQHYGKQNLVGATNTVLEYRQGFTAAIAAAAKAYGRGELIETASVKAKVVRNLGLEDKGDVAAQLHAYNPVISFLFPEAAPHLSDARAMSE